MSKFAQKMCFIVPLFKLCELPQSLWSTANTVIFSVVNFTTFLFCFGTFPAVKFYGMCADITGACTRCIQNLHSQVGSPKKSFLKGANITGTSNRSRWMSQWGILVDRSMSLLSFNVPHTCVYVKTIPNGTTRKSTATHLTKKTVWFVAEVRCEHFLKYKKDLAFIISCWLQFIDVTGLELLKMLYCRHYYNIHSHERPLFVPHVTGSKLGT